MIIFHDVRDVPAGFGPSVVAIGKFDGVHTGHRALLERAKAHARQQRAVTVAVTFDRNPLRTLRPEICPDDLISLEQKIALLGETGIDAVLVLRFDADMAAMPADDFIQEILVDGLDTKTVLLGHDFRFGHGGAGDAALLERRGATAGFTTVVVDDVDAGQRRVSSTWIRTLLEAGDVEAAATLLGRPHTMRGEVVHGLKRGRELGFPTANLSPAAEGDVPADGIYAGWLVDAAGTVLPAAISVGTNPTFDDVPVRQVEAYVLDETDLDLYGQIVEIRFIRHIRGMVAFHGIPALVEQMTDDVERVRDVLRH